MVKRWDGIILDFQLGINEIQKALASSSCVLGYGAGRYGRALAWLAKKNTWYFSGFLVSDGEKHPDSIYGYPVMQVSEVENLNEAAIILSVNEKLRLEIVQSLPKCSFKTIDLPNAFFENVIYKYKMMEESLRVAEEHLEPWRHKTPSGHMRVVFFTHGSELLGANRSLVQNLLYWKELGVEPLVISLGDGDLNKLLWEQGIPNLSVPFSWWVKRNDKHQISDNFSIEDKLSDVLRKYQFDLIYSNSSVIDIGAHMAERLKLPHIWHIREFVEEDFGWHFLRGRKEALEYILAKSNAVICISKSLLQKCEDVVQRKNVFCLIPNGVCLDTVEKRQSSEFCQDVLRIGMCGFVQESKNQKELLVAMNSLPENVLQHFEAEFYGPQDPVYQKELDEYIRGSQLEAKVRFCGYTTDVANRLRTCQIGVMASRMEAFGRVTVEYMLSGLLTIASDTGANPELLRNGRDGLLYEYGNPNSLAKCLIWCEKHRSEMQEMANLAQTEAKNRFAPQRTAESIYNVMQDALEKGRI